MSDFGLGAFAGAAIDTSSFGMSVNAAMDAISPVADALLGGIKIFEAYNPFSFVTFDYNPKDFTVKRVVIKRERASTVEGFGGNNQTDKGTYSTEVKFTALITEEDPGSFGGAVMDAALGQGIVNRANTLMGWCTTGVDKSPLALATGAVLAAIKIKPDFPSRRPLLVLTWGDPLRGHLMLGLMKEVSVKYIRFSSTGNPIRAEVTCTFNEKRNPVLSFLTNPTSGGVAGRRGHTLTQGENLQAIATSHYGRPQAWRALADDNGIDDPFRVRPGRQLLLAPDDEARS